MSQTASRAGWLSVESELPATGAGESLRPPCSLRLRSAQQRWRRSCAPRRGASSRLCARLASLFQPRSSAWPRPAPKQHRRGTNRGVTDRRAGGSSCRHATCRPRALPVPPPVAMEAALAIAPARARVWRGRAMDGRPGEGFFPPPPIGCRARHNQEGACGPSIGGDVGAFHTAQRRTLRC